MPRLLLVLALLLATQAARAQWTPVPMPAGVSSGTVVVSGAVVAFGDAVFVALLGGVGAPVTPGASTYTVLFVSRDGGATWAAVPEFVRPTPSTFYVLGAPSVVDGVLYLPLVSDGGTGTPVFSTVARTSDGTTWTLASTGIEPRDFQLNNVAAQGGALYGVSRRATGDGQAGYVYRSADGGASWARVGAPRTTGVLTGAGGRLLIGFDRFGTAGGERSADGGATWTPHGSRIFSAARNSDGVVLTANGSRLQRSTDGGVSFAPLAASDVAVGVGACGTTFVYADALGTAGPHVRRSDDGGVTFTPWAEGLPDNGLNGLSFSCSSDGPGAGSATVYHVTFGGENVYRRRLSEVSAASEASLDTDVASVAVVPNPVADAATLRLTLDAPQTVRVRVIDALGREVLRMDRALGAGPQQITLGVAGLAPGLYVARIVTLRATASASFTVVR